MPIPDPSPGDYGVPEWLLNKLGLDPEKWKKFVESKQKPHAPYYWQDKEWLEKAKLSGEKIPLYFPYYVDSVGVFHILQ